MIRVTLAQEPASFDKRVRQKGLSAIAELVGEPQLKNRPGPKRTKKHHHRDEIPASEFPPYWEAAIEDLLVAYHRQCAFLSCYIEPATGTPTTDHMIPKSRDWERVYEWTNYRLASHLMNSLKSDLIDFLDPIDIRDDWFGLDIIEFQVYSRQAIPARSLNATQNTLWCLNQRECCQLRREYVENYWDGHIDFDYLTRRSPFVARELHRLDAVNTDDK
jgi:hypothetical protein